LIIWLAESQAFIFQLPDLHMKKRAALQLILLWDTFKGEVWKAVASKAANKVLYPSSAPVNQQQYLSNFQGFGNFGPHNYPGQSYSEPSLIPKPEEIFGFKIYICKKCASINTLILSFNEGGEGGSKISWTSCCNSSDLKDVKENSLQNNNEILQKIQNKLKYCVQTWTSKKPRLAALRIPESLHGNSVRLLQERNKRSISLEYSSEKNIELDIDDENHWARKAAIPGSWLE
jgi:hypothetical protein